MPRWLADAISRCVWLDSEVTAIWISELRTTVCLWFSMHTARIQNSYWNSNLERNGVCRCGHWGDGRQEWDTTLIEWTQGSSVNLFHLRWEGTMLEARKFTSPNTKSIHQTSSFQDNEKGLLWLCEEFPMFFILFYSYCNRSLDRLSWGNSIHSWQPETIEV